MCSERSRIPVLSFQVPKVINVAEEKIVVWHSSSASEQQPLLLSKKNLKKTANLEPCRDRAFVFGVKASEHIVFKGATQGVTKVQPPPPKKAIVQCPVNRYKREAELRNKNKLLESARSEMIVKLERAQWEGYNVVLEHKKSLQELTVLKGSVKELKEQCESLQKENQELKQFQKCCRLVLETHSCLSDAGSPTMAKEEMKEEQAEMMECSPNMCYSLPKSSEHSQNRGGNCKESGRLGSCQMCEKIILKKVLTEKLNTDLELFCKMAKEQKDHLQTTKMTWKQVEEEQAHFREKQQCFQRRMKEFADILDQEDEFVTAEIETTTFTL